MEKMTKKIRVGYKVLTEIDEKYFSITSANRIRYKKNIFVFPNRSRYLSIFKKFEHAYNFLDSICGFLIRCHIEARHFYGEPKIFRCLYVGSINLYNDKYEYTCLPTVGRPYSMKFAKKVKILKEVNITNWVYNRIIITKN